jgi:hypothetical protein
MTTPRLLNPHWHFAMGTYHKRLVLGSGRFSIQCFALYFLAGMVSIKAAQWQKQLRPLEKWQIELPWMTELKSSKATAFFPARV